MLDPLDIKTLRETLGVTQTQLAEMVGVAQGDISNWETKKHAPSRAARKTLERLLEEHRQSAAA
jgi:DNA-binding transcriptional regulator YiaG